MPLEIENGIFFKNEIDIFLDCARVNFTLGKPADLATLQIVNELETIQVLDLQSVFHNDDMNFAHPLSIDRKYSDNLYY